jgi:hypothetical protein
MRERTSVANAVSRWIVSRTEGSGTFVGVGPEYENENKNPRTRFPVLTLVWALVAVTASVYVFVDHPDHRLRFFTNWSMICHAIIAIFLLLVYFQTPDKLFSESHVGPIFLALDWCISWVVLVGSRFIIADSTDWTITQFKADPWVMAWGDFVYHILPPLMSIGLVWDHPRTSNRVSQFPIWAKALISLAPAVFMLSYRAAFDPKDVYMLHTRADALGLDALSALAVLFAALVFWFVPMKSNHY